MLVCLLEIWAILCGRHRWVAVQWGEGFAVIKMDRWGEEGVVMRKKRDGEKGGEILLNVCQKSLKRCHFQQVSESGLGKKPHHAIPLRYVTCQRCYRVFTLRPVWEDWGNYRNEERCSLTGSHVFESLKRPNKEFRCLSASCFVVLSSRCGGSPVVTATALEKWSCQ